MARSLRPSRRVLDTDSFFSAIDLAPLSTIDVSSTAYLRPALMLFGEKSMSSEKVAAAFRIGEGRGGGRGWGGGPFAVLLEHG